VIDAFSLTEEMQKEIRYIIKQNNVFDAAFCEKIMKVDQALRFAGIFTSNGELTCSKMRHKATSMLTPEEIQMSIYYAKLRHKTRDHLVNQIGKPEFSLTKYEKVIRFTIPIGKDILLLLSADTNANYAKITDKVLKVIKETKTS